MGKPMTEERLAEIEARAQAATPGPWRSGRPYGDGGGPTIEDAAENDVALVARRAWVVCASEDHGAWRNAEFIIAAREAVPDLVDEVRRRGDRIAELTEALRNLDAALPEMPPNGHGIPTPCPVCCLPRCTPECARAAARRVFVRKDGGE